MDLHRLPCRAGVLGPYDQGAPQGSQAWRAQAALLAPAVLQHLPQRDQPSKLRAAAARPHRLSASHRRADHHPGDAVRWQVGVATGGSATPHFSASRPSSRPNAAGARRGMRGDPASQCALQRKLVVGQSRICARGRARGHADRKNYRSQNMCGSLFSSILLYQISHTHI